MRINKLTQFSYISNINRPSINNKHLLNAPIQDTVVFKGKHTQPPKPVSHNITSSVQLAEKLLQVPMDTDLSLELIEKIVREQSPDVSVHDIKELALQIPDYNNYGAFFNCELADGFNIKNKRIYINTAKANKSPQCRLSTINDIAHEHTHAMQMKEGKILDILQSITNGNIEYSKFIQAMGDFVFKPIDTELQAKAVIQVFNNPVDIMSNMLYGFFYPREQEVKKQDILNSLGLKNEKEFKAMVLKQFDYACECVYKFALSNPEIAQMVPGNANYNKIRSKVKAYCAHSALKEKEAYTAESIVSKQYLKTDKSLNLDIFPLYYEMVANALKES